MEQTMNYHEISTHKKTNYRKSGFLLAGITAAFYTFQLIRGNHLPSVAVGATVLAILASIEARPLHKVIDLFIMLGNFMHRFTNPLMFGLIYIFAVIPTALILKLFGKELLPLHYDNKATSYWHYRTNSQPWKESFRKQY